MRSITVLAMGKLKEKFYIQAVEEYTKRLSGYCRFQLTELPEYRLPEAKAGTAMYFDFPRRLQSRSITFRLLGDVTAFADDPTEQDDSSFGSPIAVGLSLANRIKLYYYADPYELGKWASLSAV